MYATMDEEVDNIEALSINQTLVTQRIILLLKYYVNDCLWYDLVSLDVLKNILQQQTTYFNYSKVNITYFTNCLYAKF